MLSERLLRSIHTYVILRDCDCVNKVMGCTVTPVIGSTIAISIRLKNGLCTQFSGFLSNSETFSCFA